MKALLCKMALCMSLVLGVNEVLARQKSIEKKKVIEKSYAVSPTHILQIINKFGRVHVNTWDKATIEVKIDIIARGNNEDRIREILDQIEVDIVSGGSIIKFETQLKGKMNNKKSEQFEINYLVNMPVSNPLILTNSFGETYLADFKGKLKLDVSYGHLKAERLSGDSEVKMSFSEAQIQEVTLGELEVKYSELAMEVLGNVKLDQGFSELRVDKAGDLSAEVKYGELRVGELNTITGKLEYSEFHVEKVVQGMVLKTAYCGDFNVKQVSNKFGVIDLDGEFGAFKVGFEKGVNASFDFQMKFCDFNQTGLDVYFSRKESSDFKKEYEGKLGKGAGGKIKVRSSYGDVKFHLAD